MVGQGAGQVTEASPHWAGGQALAAPVLAQALIFLRRFAGEVVEMGREMPHCPPTEVWAPGKGMIARAIAVPSPLLHLQLSFWGLPNSLVETGLCRAWAGWGREGRAVGAWSPSLEQKQLPACKTAVLCGAGVSLWLACEPALCSAI